MSPSCCCCCCCVQAEVDRNPNPNPNRCVQAEVDRLKAAILQLEARVNPLEAENGRLRRTVEVSALLPHPSCLCV